MYDVIIIKEGYCRPEAHGTMRASGSVTLLKGHQKNILVDVGSPCDKEEILQGLQKLNVRPDDIHYVVCTHGHPDHVGNVNLFPKAVLIMGYNIQLGDQYYMHDFKRGIPYEIDEEIEVWPTPGHTCEDVSVVAKKTNLGTVVAAGDLFECEADLDCPSLWQEQSHNPHQQERSRLEVLRTADFIVPGHGPMFQVPGHIKSQMRVVMVIEEQFFSSDIVSTKSECIIVESE
ncbi:metallo-beta-lactamase domain-containing protein 1 [Plakobranchus ocellatus]|uniref:Metallo-beta-lactamase domain-containing protein 1 n=1 Tax=Plakobranchus ocellatus TaxID=259542 RepID=A0AAV4DX83_9GAST|nr:metallo-beta-lactamase domain-containing protein 1 [Plakobranchus ocellatus]